MNSIIARFYSVAERNMNAPALITDDQVLNYAQLSERVTCLAAEIDHWFREHVGRPVSHIDRVGVSLDKGIDLYVSILAILAAGAGYVPVDPQATEEARHRIISASKCELILTAKWIESLSLSASTSEHQGNGVGSNSVEPIGTDICYTIFTSGSTGQPKGVDITNSNLLNLVDWAITQFSLAPGSRILQYSTINFDASVLDVFPTLLSGAALCIPDAAQRMSESSLARFCTQHEVTQAFLPPSLLTVFAPTRFPTLKVILTGGESCNPQSISDWSKGRVLYNLYGPTECTVLVSCKRMDETTPANNIGNAIQGVRLYVLDENQQPATRGELNVAGVAVAAGYHNDIAATATKFARRPELDSSVLYKTGDIVEIDGDGEIRFLGRVDRQVKIRGFRIELEEIEATLYALGYQEVALIASPEGTLVAYIVAPLPIESGALRQKLLEQLPDYKVPQYFVTLDTMPYKNSGKVDLHSLPPYSPVNLASQAPLPTDPTSTALAELWSTELNLPIDHLRPDSNFRDLGGSSINIMHLLAAIEQAFGLTIDFMDFLDKPTLEFLVSAIHKRSE
ncbi:amino acid adenylation domain-containing protein [Pseudomonas sp. ADAK2 TE3594]